MEQTTFESILSSIKEVKLPFKEDEKGIRTYQNDCEIEIEHKGAFAYIYVYIEAEQRYVVEKQTMLSPYLEDADEIEVFCKAKKDSLFGIDELTEEHVKALEKKIVDNVTF